MRPVSELGPRKHIQIQNSLTTACTKPADGPEHHTRHKHTFWLWQMWQGRGAQPCTWLVQNETGFRKGPRKQIQIQNSPTTACTYLFTVKNIICKLGARFGHGICGRGGVHTYVPMGWAVQNETGRTKGAQKTQTNTKLPSHRLHMPADGLEHHMRPRRTFWSWHMWQGRGAHACATELGRAKWGQSQKRGPENTNKYRTPQPPPAHAC